MERFTSNKESDTIRCTICGGLISGELTYTGDNYCKGHENKQLNIDSIRLSLPTEEEIAKRIGELPYTKHLDDGQYNDGVITGFELGTDWMQKQIENKLRQLFKNRTK